MTYWKIPPIIKVYEALGAVADSRVHLAGDSAKVYSSSGNKFYEVNYDASENAIMTNDNGSYWKGYLGYPAIAYLLATDVLEYKQELGDLLKNITWKDLNTKFKNDFSKTLEHILFPLPDDRKLELEEYTDKLLADVAKLKLKHLGKKVPPPAGY